MNVEPNTPAKRERVAPANNRWAGHPLTHAARTRRAARKAAALRNYTRNREEAALKPQAHRPVLPPLRVRPVVNGGTRRRCTKKKSN